jgi:hypothetical protein
MIDEKILVERLEAESDFFSGEPMGSLQKHFYCEGVRRSIEIVKELAEESNKNIENSYISRTEVLLLIESIKDNKDIPKNYGTLLDILRQIRNMPTVSIDNGWIPCSERLPKYLENVLICTETGFVTIAYMQGEIYGNSWADGLGLIREVIAWQPLPQPFKPKE